MKRKLVMTNFRLSRSERRRIDGIAEAYRMSRTELMRNLVSRLPDPPPTLRNRADFAFLTLGPSRDTP